MTRYGSYRQRTKPLWNNDYLELMIMIPILIYLPIELARGIFIQLTVPEIIILSTITIFSNIGAFHLTKILINEYGAWELNSSVKNHIGTKLVYVRNIGLMFILLIILYLLLYQVFGDVLITMSIVLTLDFIHDLRLYIIESGGI